MSYKTFYGPDISSYQTVVDWDALNKGAAFIMIKASGNDGGNYVDGKYEDNIAHTRSFGNALPRIVYNFCGGSDAINDANYFVDSVGVNLQVGEVYEFDCERGAAVTPAYALQVLNEAKSRLGWGGGVYVSQARLISEDWSPVAAAGYFVHPADWSVSTADNFSVGAFKNYSLQQYTDHATWPGITAPCDGNAFFGNAAIDILKLGRPGVTPPAPLVVVSPPAAVPVAFPLVVSSGSSTASTPTQTVIPVTVSTSPTAAPSASAPTTIPTSSPTLTVPTAPPGTAIDIVNNPAKPSLTSNTLPPKETIVGDFSDDIGLIERFVLSLQGKKTYAVGVLMILTSVEKYLTGTHTLTQYLTTVQGILGSNGLAVIAMRAAIAKIPKV